MTRFVLAFCLVRSQWSGKVYLGVHYADGCAPECMGQAWASQASVCFSRKLVNWAGTDSEGGWYLGPPSVVCLEGIQIFKMVKMFRMLDECSGKRVYQDPWSKVKAKNKNKTEVNIRGLWLYSMFVFRLVITWLIGETVNQGKSLHFRKKMSSSLQLSITIPS